jgi:E3 ubiquitin-protein ligase UBR4
MDKLMQLEKVHTMDLSQGYVLKKKLEILVSFLDVPEIKLRFKQWNLMEQILDSFLTLRGIIVQKNKLIDDSSKLMSDIMDKIKSDSEEDQKAFMVACIKSLDKHRDSNRIQTFIFEQMCNIVCPTKPEEVYQLILNKSHTNEEFIRGSMTNNPYSSTDLGVLMRDVKNKICTTLDLTGLLEDDNSMELLVNNKIIKLDLSIKQVYKHVWKKTTPMVVVYRLQGLDGEATEEIVDSLPEDAGEERDPEEEYKIANVMSQFGGLEAMAAVIQRFNDFQKDHEIAYLAFKLLFYSCKVKANCRAMLNLGGINLLLSKLKLAAQQQQYASDLAELVLQTLELLVQQANTMKGGVDFLRRSTDGMAKSQGYNVEDGISQMQMLLRLAIPLAKTNPKILRTISRIVPFLTYGERKIMEILVEHFLPFLDFERFDQQHLEPDEMQQSLHLEFLANICDNINTVEEYANMLKEVFLTKKITQRLASYLSNLFSKQMDQAQDISESPEWKDAVSKPSLVYVLQYLTGLSRSHLPTKKLIYDQNLIPIIHLLTKVTAVKRVGNLAENLLETLREEDEGSEAIRMAVENISGEEMRQKRKQAEEHRKKVLQELNLNRIGENKVASASKMVIEGMEDLEEEAGLKCMVCQEGYTFKPMEILGVYTFSKRVNMGMLMESKGRQDSGFTTITNFNLIHFQCHREATKAERLLKPPKEEWEGATIRNQHTKCNNLFPILGSKTPLDTYAACVEKYWNNLMALDKCESPRFRVLAHDLKNLLLYYAKEESLSAFSHGGSLESNIKMIPFMIQMGLYLLDQKGSSQRKIFEKSLSQFLSQPQNNWINMAAQVDNVFYMLILSLYLLTLEEWKESKIIFIKHLLTFSYCQLMMQKKHATSKSIEASEIFRTCRPALIFFSIVDKLQSTLKKPSGAHMPLSFTNISHKPDEPWLKEMFDRIQNDDIELIEMMNGILTLYKEEFVVYEDFQEFFDEQGNKML